MKTKIDKRLLKKLGFHDYRDFVHAFGYWCYNNDFSGQECIYSFDRLLKAFIRYMLQGEK
jgi:hypothetical protein